MKKLLAILLIVIIFTGCNTADESTATLQEPLSDPNLAATEPKLSEQTISRSYAPRDFDSEEDLFAAIALEPDKPEFIGLTEIYRPRVIPEGYKLSCITVVDAVAVEYVYSNNQGESIMFIWDRYVPAPATIESRDRWLDGGETRHKKTKKNGVEYLFLIYEDEGFFVAWVEDGKSFWADTTDINITEQELLDFCKYEAVKVP